MATPKHRAEGRGAMTRREYDRFVEKHGHTPTWPPVHAHSANTALQNQKDNKSLGQNQVPPHRSTL